VIVCVEDKEKRSDRAETDLTRRRKDKSSEKKKNQKKPSSEKTRKKSLVRLRQDGPFSTLPPEREMAPDFPDRKTPWRDRSRVGGDWLARKFSGAGILIILIAWADLGHSSD